MRLFPENNQNCLILSFLLNHPTGGRLLNRQSKAIVRVPIGWGSLVTNGWETTVQVVIYHRHLGGPVQLTKITETSYAQRVYMYHTTRYQETVLRLKLSLYAITVMRRP